MFRIPNGKNPTSKIAQNSSQLHLVLTRYSKYTLWCQNESQVHLLNLCLRFGFLAISNAFFLWEFAKSTSLLHSAGLHARYVTLYITVRGYCTADFAFLRRQDWVISHVDKRIWCILCKCSERVYNYSGRVNLHRWPEELHTCTETHTRLRRTDKIMM